MEDQFKPAEPEQHAAVEPSTAQPQAPVSTPSSGVRRDAIVLIVVVIAVAIMISSAVFWSRKKGALPAPPANTVASLQGNVQGVAAPDFTLKTLDGKDVRLSDFKGKAVLLNFWATYCQPCKIEMPWFAELNKQYAPQGLEVIGVAMDDVGVDAIRKYATELGVNYPILVGKESVADLYGGMQFLPTTFYIDRQGKIVDRVFGLVSHSEIESNVKKALATASAEAPASK
jgi:cytochrome c biogenesis protein CcmG/thiol:disulfide interchange protein DsbE